MNCQNKKKDQACATTAYCNLEEADRILARIDFEAVRSSGRLLDNMFNCFIDGVKCTPDAGRLREFFPEILSTCCAECSDKLLMTAKTMLDFLYEKKPEYGRRVLDRFDADGKYREKCDEELKAKGLDFSRF